MTSPLGEIVVPDELGLTGHTLMGVALNIGAELTDLNNRLLPVKEFWVGGAGDGWQEVQGRWDGASREIMDADGTLGDMSRATSTNWENYVITEQSNIRTWSSF
jgi:uncharacterized protein YukE